VRPWGLWKPVLQKVRERHPEFHPNKNFKRDMFNVAIGIAWQTSLVALPIYLVIHEFSAVLVTLAIVIITSAILKFTWWDTLDDATEVAIQYIPPRAAPESQLSMAGEKQ
jgi:solute:Na+ symporter, SSS family